jgi:hypothetical protein
MRIEDSSTTARPRRLEWAMFGMNNGRPSRIEYPHDSNGASHQDLYLSVKCCLLFNAGTTIFNASSLPQRDDLRPP